MPDDNNVLAALDAVIAGFGTRSETRAQTPTIGKVAKPPQPKQEVNDNNNNIESSYSFNSSMWDILCARKGSQNFRENFGDDSSLKSLPEKRCRGQYGQVTDNVEYRQHALETRWHLDHGERVSREVCAGCRGPIAPGEEALDLADGNRVHFGKSALPRARRQTEESAKGYSCLIAWGERWRQKSRAAGFAGLDQRMSNPCEECGGPLPSVLGKASRRFCSQKCQKAAYRRVRGRPAETVDVPPVSAETLDLPRTDEGGVSTGAATGRENQQLQAEAVHAAAQQRAHEDILIQILTRALAARKTSTSLPYEVLRQSADAAGLREGNFARTIGRLVGKGRVERHDDGTGHPTYGLPAVPPMPAASANPTKPTETR
jgi:hypothetical protein